MPKIVSVSRRTDIPAFYGWWFLGRLQAGFAGWRNPFGGQRNLVSLARRDVAAFVFWSKNFRPFLPVLETIRAAGYPAMFHYTITGLPREFEAVVVPPEDAIDSLREVSRRFGPEHVTWLARLHPGTPPGRLRPTRSGCGCTESADIGAYDSCPHGCIYCYANVNKAKAEAVHLAHDPESAFLGVPRAVADRWVEEILRREGEAPGGPGTGNRPAWRTDLGL